MAVSEPDNDSSNGQPVDRSPLYLEAWESLDIAMAAQSQTGVRAAMGKFAALTAGQVRFCELDAFFGAHTTLAYEPVWLAWNHPKPEDTQQTRQSLARLLVRRPILVGQEPRPYQAHVVRIMGLALALRDEEDALATHDSPTRQDSGTFHIYYPGGTELVVEPRVSGTPKQSRYGPICLGLGRVLERALQQVLVPSIQTRIETVPLGSRRSLLVELCRRTLIDEITGGISPKTSSWLDVSATTLTQTARSIALQRVSRSH